MPMVLKTDAALPSSPAGAVRWEQVGTQLKRRCVFMVVYGDTGTGRSSLALSAPGPIALLHAAEKLDGIAEAAVNAGREVRMHNFGGIFYGNSAQSKADTKLKEFKAAWRDAMTWARTIIVDTHTELWELMRLARFGTVTPQGKVVSLYTPVNAEWRSIWKMFREQNNCNVIAIGQTGDEYKNDKATGRTKMMGQKEMGYMADVIVRTSKTITNDGPIFQAVVEKGWFNASIEGIPWEDESANFPTIMSAITGSVDIWEK